MKSYKRILVAVDFSVVSEHAAMRAVELAGFYSASLVFLHVVEHFPEHLPHYQMSDKKMDPEEFISDRADIDLQQLCARLGCENAERKVVLTKHSAKGEIMKVIEDNGVDLIVLGSQGRHRLNEILAGSTATGIVRTAPCDVMTVRLSD